MRSSRGTAGMLVLACVIGACGTASHPERKEQTAEAPTPETADPTTRPLFCERDGDDGVRDLFCATTPPEIYSLSDLQVALRLSPGYAPAEAMSEGDVYVRFAVLLGHSTALSGHLVSPINPRALVLGVGTVLAFQRGAQQVELATLARDRRAFNFYLLEFEQACQQAPEGCTPADLYSPRIEKDWSSYRVRDAEDLKNTPLDCRQCHQRGRENGTLLMREFTEPWTHFFEPISVPEGLLLGGVQPPPTAHGADLSLDYLAAKGAEIYANVDVAALPRATPSILQAAVGADQPLYFDSLTIQQERFPYRDGVYPSEPQRSTTWEDAFESFKRGEQLALPFLETRATDPDKQAALSEAYRRFSAGELSDEELPDLADIFPDDPQTRARIGLQTEPGATAEEALIQACGPCHNDVLDQSLSRARFNVDVSRLSPSELDLAIARIRLDAGAPFAMPPRGARQLDPAARQRLLSYLKTDARSGRPDERLVRAARLGMTGGARKSP